MNFRRYGDVLVLTMTITLLQSFHPSPMIIQIKVHIPVILVMCVLIVRNIKVVFNSYDVYAWFLRLIKDFSFLKSSIVLLYFLSYVLRNLMYMSIRSNIKTWIYHFFTFKFGFYLRNELLFWFCFGVFSVWVVGFVSYT